MRKVWVVYVTCIAGLRGADSHQHLDHVELKFDETTSPNVARIWAKDLVGKVHSWPATTSLPTEQFGLVVYARAVEEERPDDRG